jgi:uncharacterized protein
MTAFSERYGPWAVVTGAAQGMGAAFAAELAARQVRVVLVDRDIELLRARATELGAAARTIAMDLGETDAGARLVAALADLDVGLIVSNAAVSYVGPFVDQGLEDALQQLDVNCRIPLALAHAFAPRLRQRGRGGIVFVSSLSALRGAPLVSGYAATKAWNLVLAESLWDELRDDGVDVMAVMPGSTRTPGFMASHPQAGLGTAHVMEPADVARETLDALGSGPSFVPGAPNRDAEAFMAALDRTEAVRLMGEAMRAMYPPGRSPDPTL